MMMPELTADLIFSSLLYTIMGLAAHILRKCSEQGVTPYHYLAIHKRRSTAALSAVASAYAAVLFFEPNATGATYFALGYVLDSAFNKAPTKEEVEFGAGVKVKKIVDLNQNGIPDYEEGYMPTKKKLEEVKTKVAVKAAEKPAAEEAPPTPPPAA